MSTPIVTVRPDLPVEHCHRIMEEKQIRRVLVVNAAGELCGIVALADVARYSTKRGRSSHKGSFEPTKSASATAR